MQKLTILMCLLFVCSQTTIFAQDEQKLINLEIQQKGLQPISGKHELGQVPDALTKYKHKKPTKRLALSKLFANEEAYTGNTSTGTYNSIVLATGATTQTGTIGTDPFPMAEEYANEKVYRVYSDLTFYEVNPDDGSTTLLGTISGITGTPTGLAYNWDNSTMYVVILDAGNVPHLCTLDLSTYTATEIGSGTGMFIAMDFADDGYIYAPSIDDDNLYQIDPATGSSTLIGPIGYDLNYGQDVSFDYNTGQLYTISCGAAYIFGTYDLSTGALTQIADMSSDQYGTFVTTSIPVEPLAPAAVNNLTATPDVSGGLMADISWNNPTLTVDGTALTEITQVDLFIDGAQTPAYTNTTSSMGDLVTYAANVSEAGIHSFTVIASNSVGEGMPTTIEAYIGEDVPAAPTNIVLTDATVEPDKIASITWDAPTEGLHGGYFTGTGITYDILRYPDMVMVATGWDGTQPFLDTVSNVGNYAYEITSNNVIGSGGSDMSNSLVIGMTNQTLPFSENFNTGNDFFLESNSEANTSIDPSQGTSSTPCLLMQGNSGEGWPIGATTANDAWNTYTDHHAFATVNIDATALSPGDVIMLSLDLQQQFNYQETYSWFRVNIDGSPIQDIEGNENFNPQTAADPYTNRLFNLSTYAGSLFTLQFQTSCKYLEDLALIDNVSIYQPQPYDLKAVNLIGNNTPSANTETTNYIVLSNLGANTASDYKLELFEEGNPIPIADTNIVGHDILPLETDTLGINWIPTAVDTINIKGVVTLTGDGNNFNDTTDYKEIYVYPEGTSVVTIGDITTLQSSAIDIPFDFFWKNSLSSTIYFSDEINTGGMITGINYYYNFSTPSIPASPVKIWVTETSLDDLTAGFVPSTDLTLVYDGTFDFIGGSDQIMHIDFTTPFIYSGAGNLLFLCNRPMDIDYYSSSDKFYTTVTDNFPNRTIACNSDSEEYDPANPPVFEEIFNEHPDISLFMITAGLGTLNGNVDNGSDPIEGATVAVLGETNGFEMTTTTDASGFYEFPYLPEDNYEVAVSMFGYISDTTAGVAVVESVTTTHDVTLAPIPTFTVSGNVIDNFSSSPLENAHITLTGYENYSDSTDASGDFSIVGVYDGFTYELMVSLDGYVPYESSVTVNGSNVDLGTIALDIELEDPFGIYVDQSNSPLGEAMVYWNAGFAGSILVVDHDASNAQTFTDDWTYIQPALDELGYEYTYFESDATSFNGPDLATMMEYDLVFWFTGEGWQNNQTMTAQDESNLADYLDAGGKLFLSAQDYIWDVYSQNATHTFSAGQFPYDYLGVTTVTQDAWWNSGGEVIAHQGVNGTFAEGLDFTCTDIYTTKEGLSADKIDISTSAPVIEVTDAPVGPTAVANSNTVFWAGSFAAVDGLDTKVEVLSAILDYLATTSAKDNSKAFMYYNIYLDDMVTPIGNTVDSAYQLTGLTPGQEYLVGITAVYDEGTSEMDSTSFIARLGESGTDFLTYSIPDESEAAAIDDANHTIDVFINAEMYDSANVVATFTLSDSAIATIGGTMQVSGITEVDFSMGTATYLVEAEDGTAQEWVVTLHNSIGIANINDAGYSIYPNPAKDLLNIKSTETIQTIQIMNAIGELVQNSQVTGKDIKLNINGLKAGVYFVQIKMINRTVVQKVQIIN